MSRKICLLGLIWVWLLASAFAGETFTLTEETNGVAWGPFRFEDGTTLRLAEKTYILKKDIPNSAIGKSLAIVLPELIFRKANIQDVVDFFSEGSRVGTNQLNIVLDSTVVKTPPITVTLYGCTIEQGLRTICDLGNLDMEVREDIIWIRQKRLRSRAEFRPATNEVPDTPPTPTMPE